jgi:3-hydroxyisobutyrate dehydrogenase-like beta-hydroxyacid dehydrogenase
VEIKLKIAFIGLGNMGSGIASCIHRAGYDLTVWNRTASKMAPLVETGIKAATSAKEAALSADVVITSLMDDKSILENVRGPEGILAGMKPGAIHLCLTTISPACADQLEALHRGHGTRYVSGPVVGRPDAAATGQLLTFLAGDANAIETVTPICRAYAKQVNAISDRPRLANCMKLCINFNAIAMLEMMGETYVLAEKCGLPLEPLRDFYQQTFAHPASKMYAEKLRARDFGGRGGFVMSGGLKDVQLMLTAASQAGATLEIGAIVERKLKSGIEAGLGDADWSAFYEITRREASLS